MSFHPVMSGEDVEVVCDAIAAIARHGDEWARVYRPLGQLNDFRHVDERTDVEEMVAGWFDVS